MRVLYPFILTGFLLSACSSSFKREGLTPEKRQYKISYQDQLCRDKAPTDLLIFQQQIGSVQLSDHCINLADSIMGIEFLSQEDRALLLSLVESHFFPFKSEIEANSFELDSISLNAMKNAEDYFNSDKISPKDIDYRYLSRSKHGLAFEFHKDNWLLDFKLNHCITTFNPSNELYKKKVTKDGKHSYFQFYKYSSDVQFQIIVSVSDLSNRKMEYYERILRDKANTYSLLIIPNLY